VRDTTIITTPSQHKIYRTPKLLGILSAKGVLHQEFKPACSVGDLLTQHLDELEQEVERKGGVLQTLNDHFSKNYRIHLARKQMEQRNVAEGFPLLERLSALHFWCEALSSMSPYHFADLARRPT